MKKTGNLDLPPIQQLVNQYHQEKISAPLTTTETITSSENPSQSSFTKPDLDNQQPQINPSENPVQPSSNPIYYIKNNSDNNTYQNQIQNQTNDNVTAQDFTTEVVELEKPNQTNVNVANISHPERKEDTVNLEAKIIDDDKENNSNTPEQIPLNNPIHPHQIEKIILELQLQETAHYLVNPANQRLKTSFLGEIEKRLNNLINHKR